MPEPPISYTERNYQNVRTALINWIKLRFPKDWPEFIDTSIGMAILDVVAWAHGQRAYYYDIQARNCYLETANLPENILAIARSLGYERRLATAASVPVALYPEPQQVAPITIRKGEKIYLDDLIFEAADTYLIPANTAVWPNDSTDEIIVFSEGETKLEEFTSEGTAFQVYRLSQQNILQDSISIEILGETWEKTDSLILIEGDTLGRDVFIGDGLDNQIYTLSLLNAVIDENHDSMLSVTVNSVRWQGVKEFTGAPNEFRYSQNINDETSIIFGSIADDSAPADGAVIDVYYQIAGSQKRYITNYGTNGSAIVRFGDGTYGKIPPAGATISISYRIGSGVKGNISRGKINSIIRGYLPSGASINVRVFNLEAGSGGEDIETLDRVKFVATKYAQMNKRAVRQQDWATMALTYNDSRYGSPAFAAAKLKQKKPELNTVSVALWSRDALGRITRATTPLKRGVENYLNAYKTLCTGVEIIDGDILNFDIAAQVLLRSGYTIASTLDAVTAILRQHFNSVYVQPGIKLALSLLIDKILTVPQIESVTLTSVQGSHSLQIDFGQSDGVTKTFSSSFEFPRGQQILPRTFIIYNGTQTITDNGDGTLIGDIDNTGTNSIDYIGGKFTATFLDVPSTSSFIMAECRYEALMLNEEETTVVTATNTIDHIVNFSPIIPRRNIGFADGLTISKQLPLEFLPLAKNRIIFIGGYDHYGVQTGGQLLAYDDGEGNIIGDVVSGTVDYDTGVVSFQWNTTPPPVSPTTYYGYLAAAPDGIKKTFNFSVWTDPGGTGSRVALDTNVGRVKFLFSDMNTVNITLDTGWDNGDGIVDSSCLDSHVSNVIDYKNGSVNGAIGVLTFNNALDPTGGRTFKVYSAPNTIFLYSPFVIFWRGTNPKILIAENTGHLFGTLVNTYPYANLDFATGHIKAELTSPTIAGRTANISYDSYVLSNNKDLPIPTTTMPSLSNVTLTEEIRVIGI